MWTGTGNNVATKANNVSNIVSSYDVESNVWLYGVIDGVGDIAKDIRSNVGTH